MRWLEQIFEITWMSLATIPQRLGSALVIVGGIAGVVGVLVALLAMGEGFQSVLAQAGRLDDAIVLRKGASAELNSGLSRAEVVLIAQAPGILKNSAGVPLASAEVVVVANLPKRSSGTDANVEIRGVGPQVWELRRDTHIIEGRRFATGKRELVIGKGAQQEFAGLEVGKTVRLRFAGLDRGRRVRLGRCARVGDYGVIPRYCRAHTTAAVINRSPSNSPTSTPSTHSRLP